MSIAGNAHFRKINPADPKDDKERAARDMILASADAIERYGLEETLNALLCTFYTLAGAFGADVGLTRRALQGVSENLEELMRLGAQFREGRMQ